MCIKEVNTVSEAVPIRPLVRYISNISQYRCTVSDLPLFYIFNIYTHTHKISILEHIFISICLVVKVHIIIIYYEHLNLNL